MKNSKFLSAFLLMLTIACDSDPDPEVDCSILTLTVEIAQIREPSTCNGLDGFIEVNAIGLTPPIAYQINNGAPSNSGLFDNLGAGTYMITAQGANDCSVSESITLEEPTLTITITEINSTPSGCGENGATLEILALGTASLMYSVNGSTFQESNLFNNISAGNYTVTVRDNVCQTTEEHSVLSGVSFVSEIESIITANCAVSNCHVSGTGLPDFTVFSNVQNVASQIKSRTQSGNMPPGGRSITQDEIDFIACWVDDGAPNN